MASSTTSTNYRIRKYDLYWGGTLLGTTAPGTLNISLDGQYVDVESDQIEGIASVIPKGVIPTAVEAELQNVETEFVVSTLMANQVEVITASDGRVSGGLGFKDRNIEDIVQPLVLHPSGVDLSDDTDDILIHKSFPRIAFALSGQRDQEQRLAVSFGAIQDPTKQIGFQYGRYGAPSAIQATPDYVFLHMDNQVCFPYHTLTAATLQIGQVDRIKAGAFFSESSTTTALCDGAVLATDTTIQFDTLGAANAITASSFVQINTEIVPVESVSYTTSTSGTITVAARGVNNGGTGSAHADNDTITLLTNVYVAAGRDTATWASSTPATATVGNTFGGSGDAAKGALKGLATGSTNITATVNAVASANLAITVP